MAPQILFFDIDGTMLLTGGAGQRAMELALVEEFRISFPFEGILMSGRTDRGISNEIFQKYGLTDTPSERQRFRESYLERLPGCLHELRGGLLPGVKSLLEELASRGDVILSLLTGNYAEGAWIKLRHFQIDHYFQFGGFGDDHPHRDDVAREALSATVRQLGGAINDRRTCVIGDTPADIQCARAIGARAVAVATGTYSSAQLQPHAPDHLFENLSGDTRFILNAMLHSEGL